MEKKIDKRYFKEEVAKIEETDIDNVLENEKTITKKISNASPLRKFFKLSKIMFAMLKDVRNGSYPNMPWFTIASAALTLLYVLNPLDIIPDFIPGIGYIDDLAIMTIAMGWIETDLHSYLDWRLEKDARNHSF